MGIALKGRTILSAALALVIAIALSFPGMALADPDESPAADAQTETASADTTASDTAADAAADDDVQAADFTGVDEAANQPAAEPADANADAAAPAAATDGVAKVASTGRAFGTVQEAVDAAGPNDTITLTANTEENVTVKGKVLSFTADSKDLTFKGTLRFQGGTDGSTVKNIHFVLDGTGSVAQSVVFQGTKNAEVSGNTFDITTGADSLNKQMSSVWLQDAANSVTIADNDFNVAWGAERSNVGINLVGGAPLDSTTISGNTFTGTPAAVDKPTGSAMFVVGNGNTTAADTYGITNLKVTDNTVVNNTGKEGADTRVYGVSVIGTKGTVVSGNSFEGNLYLAIAYSTWPNQGPNTDLTATGNEIDAYAGFFFPAGTVTEGGLSVSSNTFSDNVAVPYASGISVADGNGATYPSVAAALQAGASKVVLLKYLSEDVTIPAGTTVEIDLAGHKLANASGDTITNNGTLTVSDSVGGGVVDNTAHGKAALRNAIDATATLNGGTFKRSAEAGTSDGANGNSYYTLLNWGTMTINDGVTVESKLADGSLSGHSSVIANGFYNGIKDNPQEKAATLTINGGTIEGGLYVKNDEYGVLDVKGGSVKGSNAAVLNYGTATVEGGTLSAGNDNARVVWNIKVDQSPKSSPGSFEMTGGTINATGNQTALYQDVANGVGSIKVTGGTVNGPIAVSKAVDSDPTAGIALSGGTYSEAPADAYVVEGSGLKKQDDGTYAVAKAQIVFANAANGTVSYAISKGALDEAGIIALFGAQLTVDEGYSDVAVDAASLKALNDAIAAGTVGSYEVTFTAEKKAEGEDSVVEALTAKGTVNLTKDGAPDDQVTDNKTPNDQNQNDNADKTAKSQSPKTSDSMMLYAVAAVALVALGGVGVSFAMRRRFNK